MPSSIREGLGLNVLEAMVCGVPVVAYDNRGHRSIIRDGENGYIVPNGDAKAMASRILELINDGERADQLAQTAKAEIQQYSVSAVVIQMRRIYRER